MLNLNKFLLFYVFFLALQLLGCAFYCSFTNTSHHLVRPTYFTRQNFQEFSMSLAFLHKSCAVDFKDMRHRPTEPLKWKRNTLFHQLFNRINISLESAASTASSYSATVHFLSTLSLAFQR